MDNPKKRGPVSVAPPQLNSRERLEVYKRLCLLNSSFSSIVQVLDELAQTRIFSIRDLRQMRGHTQQVQLEINTKLLPPLESVEQNDHAQFGKVGIADGKETRRQVSRSTVQAPPVVRILLAIFAVLTVLLVFASLRVKRGADWVYRSQDGMPMPCPPPHRGLFPRDCH
jgi:hypothetical protein